MGFGRTERPQPNSHVTAARAEKDFRRRTWRHQDQSSGAIRHAAQRDQRQSRRDQDPQTARSWLGLGQGQDGGPRRQGPDGPLGRAHRRVRRRSDAACIAGCPSAVSTLCRRRASTRCNFWPGAVGDRCRTLGPQQARRCRSAAGRRHDPQRALDGVRLLAKGELKAKVSFSVRGASAGARGGRRQGRWFGHAAADAPTKRIWTRRKPSPRHGRRPRGTARKTAKSQDD